MANPRTTGWCRYGDGLGDCHAPETIAPGSSRVVVTRTEVVVVGAGIAGLAVTEALHAAGIDDVVVIERADAIGGTWRDNTYPGVACDIPGHLYALSTRPNPGWLRLFPAGSEIRTYLEEFAASIHPDLLLSTPMLDATWDDGARRWRLRTGGQHAGTIDADALVLACGRLTQPRIPDIPGLGTFPGALFHTARWDHGADLSGRRVAVIGTGASAVQLVPELARISDVTLVQRTPAWIVPREDRPYSEAQRARFAVDPDALAVVRDALYAEGEARFASRSGDQAASAAAAGVAEAHLRSQVSDPVLRAELTPHYTFGCKRVLLSDTFYPALASGAVHLEASALAAVEGRTLTAASGARYDVDAIVLATGFHSAQQPYAPLVHGQTESLAEHWRGGMTAFGSTVVSGFPNMFVLDGPNASLGHNSSVLMIEEQARYAARALASRDGVLRVDPAAEAAYTAEIDRAARSTPWIAGGCRNWYVDERSGRLTLLWPGTVDAFRERLSAADGSEFLTTPVGRGVSGA
jgi:cation diffusion facilitator CzcD-associated flavoprotein CzcO